MFISDIGLDFSVCCLCLVLVSGWWRPYRMSLEVFLPLQFYSHPSWSQSCFPALCSCSSPAWVGGRANIAAIFEKGEASFMWHHGWDRSLQIQAFPLWPRPGQEVKAGSVVCPWQAQSRVSLQLIERGPPTLQRAICFAQSPDCRWSPQLKSTFLATCRLVFSQTSVHGSPA